MQIRDYKTSDLPYLYDICLKTGHSGQDATSLFKDPFMIGQYYAAPYAVFDPRCVLVIEGASQGIVRPLGYMLGTTDTQAYNSWFDREWRPAAAAMYPASLPESPIEETEFSERIRRLFHTPFPETPWLSEFPGHIHIDILPEIQGGGWGARLMQAYETRLKELGCKGYHLGVGLKNERAIAFYRRLGMTELQAPAWGFVFGQRL